MLLVCIRSYLKSVMRYKFLIMDTYRPDTVHLREQGFDDPKLFFDAKRGLRARKFEKHFLSPSYSPSFWYETLHLLYLTKDAEYSRSWKAESHTVVKKCLNFCRTRKINSMFKIRDTNMNCISPVHISASYSLTSTLILSSHIHLGLPISYFLQVYRLTFFVYLLSRP
jgi:hypothetical protein